MKIAGEYIEQLLAIAIAVTASVTRFVMDKEHKTIGRFFSGVIIAGFVGFLASQTLQGVVMHEGLRSALIGVFAFVAPELLTALLALGNRFVKDPFSFIITIIEIMHGGVSGKNVKKLDGDSQSTDTNNEKDGNES